MLLIAGIIVFIAGITQTIQPTFDRFGKTSIIFAPIINTNPSPPATPAPAPYTGAGAGVGSISIPIYEPASIPSAPAPAQSTKPKQQIDKQDKEEVSAKNDLNSDKTGYGTDVNTGEGDIDGTGIGNLNISLPSLRLNKAQVKHGDILKISGFNKPESDVEIVIRFGKIINIHVKTKKNGYYVHYLDTNSLAPGTYLIQAKVDKNKMSPTDSFVIGGENIYLRGQNVTEGKKLLFWDLDDDSKINSADLSILLYWNEQGLPENLRNKTKIKIDEKVQLFHFSALIGNWTG